MVTVIGLVNLKYFLFTCQIEFLNSVIIDLQRKNDDLKHKIDQMVEASLNGNNVEDLDNHDR